MKIKNLLILPILVISLFTACDKKEEIQENVLGEVKPETLPTFNLTTTNDKTITIEVTKDGWKFEQYPNKVVLLNFFATWCPPCKAEIPHLNNLSSKYKNDFVTIGILLEEDKPNSYLNKFEKKYDIQYPVTNSEENFRLASAVGGVKAIPTMFLFNKQGLVAEKYKGAVQEEILDSDIKKILGK